MKIPAEKLARAIEKHLLPGLLRHLAKQQDSQHQEEKKSS